MKLTCWVQGKIHELEKKSQGKLCTCDFFALSKTFPANHRSSRKKPFNSLLKHRDITRMIIEKLESSGIVSPLRLLPTSPSPSYTPLPHNSSLTITPAWLVAPPSSPRGPVRRLTVGGGRLGFPFRVRGVFRSSFHDFEPSSQNLNF